MAQTPVLEVQDLRTYFYTRTGVVKAVDGVSFSLMPGETLGVVGESGSGKSMTALSIMGLVPKPAGKTVGGKVLLDGEDLLQKSASEMQHIRGRKICMILQDPMTSLNPVYTVGNQLIETLRMREEGRGMGLKDRAVELLSKVKIASPENRMGNYPHQMSGGMRQRVVGAIAMSCEPEIIIADEPTTALDVTIQLQYLRLLKEIQASTGLAIIFITHDFGVVARMCDRVAVMYAGRIVEQGSVLDLFNHPSHPYTQALMAAVPKLEERVERLYSIEGQPPLLSNLPPGCRFEPRCAHAQERCRAEYPPSFTVREGHMADCWRMEPSWQTS